MKTCKKLLVFDTHPIQYRSPVFRALEQKSTQVCIYYFNADFDGNKWWFQEVGKAKALNWGVDLLSGFKSSVIGTANLSLLGTVRKIAQILKRERPNAVLIYGYYLREHWIVWFLCQLFKIPLSFVGESFEAQDKGLKSQLKQGLRKLFYRGVSKFITIGNRTETYYVNQKVARNKITPAKYCVATDFFESTASHGQEFRKKLRAKFNIPESAFVLLFVGRLFERKRPKDVIELHFKLSSRLPLYTVLVGSGPMEKEFKADYGQMNNLNIIGFQNQEEIRSWYYAADLLLVPSEFETWGLVVNEAFACGLPALVTDTCGVSGDLVVPDETGFVYRVGDLEAAAQFIMRFYNGKDFRQNLATNAKTKILKEYHPEQFAEAILKGI